MEKIESYLRDGEKWQGVFADLDSAWMESAFGGRAMSRTDEQKRAQARLLAMLAYRGAIVAAGEVGDCHLHIGARNALSALSALPQGTEREKCEALDIARATAYQAQEAAREVAETFSAQA